MTNGKFTPEGSIINFVFFLYNHPGMNKVIEEVFVEDGESMINHLKDKLSGYIGGDSVCRPEHIAKWITELSGDRKLAVAKYINENYDCGSSGLKEGE